MPPRARCGGCRHAEHKDKCPGKRDRRPGRHCTPFVSPTGKFDHGWLCGTDNPPCPCSWRTCKCGELVANAVLDRAQAAAMFTDSNVVLAADQVIEVPIVRGSAGDPAGRLDVWRGADGYLYCRELGDDEVLIPEGHWRGREHTGACQPL